MTPVAELASQKTFCILPWIHLHVLPDSRALPCCAADYDRPVGRLDAESFEAIWNGARLRAMRRKMLSGSSCDECRGCYAMEGSYGSSQRIQSNQRFAHHLPRIADTRPDGSLPWTGLPYWDFRFSNLCNFRCRTCTALLSSALYHDETKVVGRSLEHPQLISISARTNELWSLIEESVTEVEEIYFAGGEPLLMPEHYRVLDLLQSAGRSEVRLRYNTNLSLLTGKGRSVLEYWKFFEDVSIWASLDGYGARGEFIRKGQTWARTEENILRIKNECPRLRFSVSATVSVLNILHLFEFHRYLVTRGLIGVNQLHLNLLFGPPEFRVQVLTPALKKEARDLCNEHLLWLERHGADGRTTHGFLHLMDYMDAEDLQDRLPEWRRRMRILDEARNERGIEVFPELRTLLEERG